MRLKDKVAIITGGGTGLGKNIAISFAAEGAILALASRNIRNLEETASQITAQNGEALAFQTDVTSHMQVDHMVDMVLQEYGRVDILVYNSGVRGPTVALPDLNIEDFSDTMAVNLTGAIMCCQAVIKPMLEAGGGSIILISSVAGIYGLSLRVPYSVSKGGLVSLAQSLAIEFGEKGVRINCIAPGPIESERMNRVIAAGARALNISEQDMKGKFTGKSCLGRFVTYQEVAATALFLASDESSGITGQIISVDGGLKYA